MKLYYANWDSKVHGRHTVLILDDRMGYVIGVVVWPPTKTFQFSMELRDAFHPLNSRWLKISETVFGELVDWFPDLGNREPMVAIWTTGELPEELKNNIRWTSDKKLPL